MSLCKVRIVLLVDLQTLLCNFLESRNKIYFLLLFYPPDSEYHLFRLKIIIFEVVSVYFLRVTLLKIIVLCRF